jgi:hypothetical protein
VVPLLVMGEECDLFVPESRSLRHAFHLLADDRATDANFAATTRRKAKHVIARIGGSAKRRIDLIQETGHGVGKIPPILTRSSAIPAQNEAGL